MCFFFIIGVVPRERVIGRETRLCPYDRRETSYTLYERRMWFTFFFLPLSPVSGKQVVARCDSCGLTPQEAERAPVTSGWGTKRCSQCGAELPADANFCLKCGYRF